MVKRPQDRSSVKCVIFSLFLEGLYTMRAKISLWMLEDNITDTDPILESVFQFAH